MKTIIALLFASSVSAIHLKSLGDQRMTEDGLEAAISEENLLMTAQDMKMAMAIDNAADDRLEEEIAEFDAENKESENGIED